MILEKLDEESFLTTNDDGETDELSIQVVTLEDARKIVREVVNQYNNKKHSEIMRKLLSGEWVDSDKVQDVLRMSFNECFALFDFSRTAEWWSCVGKTEEERARNGQKIVTKFRLKNISNYLENK